MSPDELRERLERARAARAVRAAEPIAGSDPPAAGPSAPPPLAAPAALSSSSGGRSSAVSAGPGSESCRSCGAAIRWLALASGRRVVVDRELVDLVDFRALYDGQGRRRVELRDTWTRVPLVYVRGSSRRRDKYGRWSTVADWLPRGGLRVPPEDLVELARTRGYRPHLATCPHAWSWVAHR